MQLLESQFSGVESLTEAVTEGGARNWYIKGVMAQGGHINRNLRLYPEDVLDPAMSKYITEFVNTRRAVGELSHPENQRINEEKISHVVEELRKDGKDYYGKAKILNTPTGKIVQALLEGGVHMGVSTRADGKTKDTGKGFHIVQPGMYMKAIDIVFAPSAHKAMMEGLMENDSMIWDSMAEDREFLESIQSGVRTAKAADLDRAKLDAFKTLLEHIRSK